MLIYSEKLTSRYPYLAAAFATIPQGETLLRRLQDLNNTWQNMLLSGSTRHYTEVVVTEDRPVLPAEDCFDIIYAGGGLNLLNAAIMSRCFGLRVLVFDRFTVGAVHREWNISRAELRELLEVGLLTPDELESVIQREYRDGLVRFHPQHVQVPAAELHLKGVLDVAVDAEKLTSLCIRKIQEQQLSGLPNVILHSTTFVHCAVQPTSGVTVDVIDASGKKLSKFMIAKPENAEAPWQVNETLNVFCHVLYDMGPRVTSAFFKDRISWRDYTRLVLKTPGYYPKIYRLAFSTLSLAEGIGWITAWLQLGRQSAGYLLYRTAKPLLRSSPISLITETLSRAFPAMGLHIAVTGEAMKQVARGAGTQVARTGKRRGIAYWLAGLWPQG